MKSQINFSRKLIFILILLSVSTFFSAAVSEIVLRLIYKVPLLTAPINSLQNDPDLGIFNTSNFQGLFRTTANVTHVKINSDGLRDHERTFQKPKSTLRILALGDSYVWGHGVEYDELFLTITESKLNTYLESRKLSFNHWTNADIVKAGVGGWGPANEFAYLLTRGHRYDPNVVILCFFTGNDFNDSMNPFQFVEYKGVRILRSSRNSISRARKIHLWLRKHLLTYGLIADVGKWFILGRSNPHPEDLSFINNCSNTFFANNPKAMTTTFGILRNFKNYCSEKKYEFYVLILPSRVEIDKKWAKKIMDQYGIDEAEINLDRPTKTIEKFCRNEGIKCFNFLSTARKEARKGQKIHLVSDSHYSAVLHRVLGQYLFEQITRELKDGIRNSDTGSNQ